jgi:hypothetical protein
MPDNKIIINEGGKENWDTYQPDVELIYMNEYTQIRFTKKAADEVNIYKRKPGNESWEFIGTAVNSPFDDHESEDNWEYCIRGVKQKKEVGIPVIISVLKTHLPAK